MRRSKYFNFFCNCSGATSSGTFPRNSNSGAARPSRLTKTRFSQVSTFTCTSPFCAALRIRHHGGRMMPANVIEGAQLPIVATRHHQRLAREIRRKKTSVFSHLIGAADHLPRFGKHTLLFELANAWIEVPGRRDGPGMIQRIMWIVEIKKVANVTLHEFPPFLSSPSIIPWEAMHISYRETGLRRSAKKVTCDPPRFRDRWKKEPWQSTGVSCRADSVAG